MSRRPVSTPVRALAALAYLLPVAIVLIAIPAYRQVRLVRVHCLSSAILGLGATVLVLLLGSLRPGGLELGLVVGVGITAVMIGYAGAVGWSAVRAYQGRSPDVPGVAALADRMDRHIAPSRVE